ncbi:lysozyme [Hyphomicrobium sp. ghe19]|uniref:lysozyme n=1 Tax=Hyphomicrobium sp. ghe19 TaxID=2682968 RepID=UPI0013677386|nr:Lysozyme RrrD [Hyphomicrobium sp. ghe19]
MANKTGAKGLDLIKVSEGYHTKLPNGDCLAYLDKLPRPVFWSKGYNGLWTIGYGSTGPGITKGTVWTKAQAEANLRKRLKEHEAALNAKQKQYRVKLDQNQYDACISASWNLGHASSLFTEVFTRLKAGDEDGAANAFLKYDHAGGVKVRGLTTRRKAERKLFLEHTEDTLYEASPRLTWMRRIRNFVGSLGIGAYFTWDTLTQVKAFTSDHAGLMLLITAALLYVSFKAIEYFTVQDHFKGLWTPSGDVTTTGETD